MANNETKKIIYQDNHLTKLLKGTILKEDEFTITVQTPDNSIIVIGKRAIVKIQAEDSP